MLICAMGSGPSAAEFEALAIEWSREGLLSPFAFALPADGGEGVRIKRVAAGEVSEFSLSDFLVSWNELPTLFAISFGRENPAFNSLGITTGSTVMRTILNVVDVKASPKQVHVYITDGPETGAPECDAEWAMRVFVAPEDRGSPENLLAPIVPGKFMGHALAGVAALGGLWATETEIGSDETASWLFAQGTQGSGDMLVLARQYSRILELPHIVAELVEAARLDPASYPNPSQDKFERVSIASQVPRMAQTFVDHFAEIQLGEPELLPPAAGRSGNLVQVAKELFQYAIARLAVKPAEIVDDLLRGLHDQAATFVESKYPGGIHVLRWDELGAKAPLTSASVDDLTDLAERLNEQPTNTLWSTYIQLCLGLIDGSDGDGTSLIEGQLYLTTEKRRILALVPSEVVADPWHESTVKSTNPYASSEEKTAAPTGTEEASVDSIKPLTSVTRELIEGLHDEATTRIEKIAELKNSPDYVSPEIQRQNHQVEIAKFAKRASRNVRFAVLGLVSWIAVSVYVGFFTNWHLTTAAIISLVVTVIASPLVLALSAWRAWDGFEKRKSELRQQEVDAINQVIREVHVRTAQRRLERRIKEIDDWNNILGMVVHHPFFFDVQSNANEWSPELEEKFPASVMIASATSSAEQVRVNQNRFRTSMYNTGWLRKRLRELELNIAPRVINETGKDEEQWLATIEGDTSQDQQSPRRVFLRLLEESLRSPDASALIERMHDFFSQYPVSEIVDEISVKGKALESVRSVDEFLALDNLPESQLLPAIWQSGHQLSDRGVITDHRIIGESKSVSSLHLGENGSLMPRMTTSRLERTARISDEGIQAFERRTAVPVVYPSIIQSASPASSEPVAEPSPIEVIAPSVDTTPEVVSESIDVPHKEAVLAAPIETAEQPRPLDVRPSISDMGVRIQVGTLRGAEPPTPVYFWPSNTELSQLNVGVVGDLGTGKTQLLKSIITQLRQSSREHQARELPMLIFDYKRDFQDEAFLKAAGGRVIEPYNIPLNVLLLRHGATERDIAPRAFAFVDIIAKIFPDIGVKQRDQLSRTVIDLYSSLGRAPLLEEVLAGYKGDGDRIDGVTATLNAFALLKIFSQDTSRNQRFEDLMGDGLLVIDLSSLKTDEHMKNALVALFLNEYYEYMITLEKFPYVGTDPQLRAVRSYLLVDEAHHILGYGLPALESLMLEGREFGIGVILSSQFLSHFDQLDTNYREALRTWFIHRVPQLSVNDLRKLGLVDASDETVDSVQASQNFESLYMSLDANGVGIRDVPFFELAQLQASEPEPESSATPPAQEL